MAEMLACPFCGFKVQGEYQIHLHIEEHHTEGSPFVADNAGINESARTVANTPSQPEDELWTKCTRPGCGEYVLITDVDEHLDYHEVASVDGSGRMSTRNGQSSGSQASSSSSNKRKPLGDITKSPQKHQRSQNRPRPAGTSLLDYFTGSSSHGPSSNPVRKLPQPCEPGRLGKRELGLHAFEKTMPSDVRGKLVTGALPRQMNRIGSDGRLVRDFIVENETPGLVPVLADLCALDRETKITYLCHPSVRHVVKLQCDGNFCGYWNIQMLLSYLQRQNGGDASASLPNVLEIQDTIETAWDAGICSYGRIETGGLRGTRKWIGTHDALAYFMQTLGAAGRVDALSFREEDSDSSEEGSEAEPSAALALLDHVEAYFMSGLEQAKHHGSSHTTQLPPMYFQRFGHSMTIVGLERRKDGSRNLLVFDPSFATSEGVQRLLDGRSIRSAPDTLLRAYRRSDASLSRWDEFEIVTLT